MAKKNKSSLPMNTLTEIPVPCANAKKIVATIKHSGKISGYKLSDGSIVDKAAGVSIAKKGEISGVGIGIRNGKDVEISPRWSRK